MKKWTKPEIKAYKTNIPTGVILHFLAWGAPWEAELRELRRIDLREAACADYCKADECTAYDPETIRVSKSDVDIVDGMAFIKEPTDDLGAMIRQKLEHMADAVEHQLLYHDFQGLPCKWHPESEAKPTLLKDDPRCRIKLGG